MKPLLALLAILSFSVTGFAQQILWQRSFHYKRARGEPRDIAITKSGKVFTANTCGPLTISGLGGSTSCADYILNFSSLGDSVSFEPQNPEIIENIFFIKELSNGKLLTLGDMYTAPYNFNTPLYGQIPYFRIMDSTGSSIFEEVVFNQASYRVTTGSLAGIKPTRDGGFWFYGFKEDSTLNLNYMPYLMRFDSGGSLLYDSTYHDLGSTRISSMYEDELGNLVMFGGRQLNRNSTRSTKAVQLIVSPSGRLLRRRYFDLDNRPNSTYSVDGANAFVISGAAHPSGGYIVYGDVVKNGIRDTTSFIALLDSSLTVTRWLRQIKENYKVKVLADGSVFLATYFVANPGDRTRSLFLRRYDSSGVLFQNTLVNTATGNWNGTPYTFDDSNYEFAGDSSVIFIGSTKGPAPFYTQLPAIYIAKIGGFPNPYTILSLPADQPLVRAPVVYPNPFQDQLTISGNGQPGRLLLFDRLGKQVYEGAYSPGEPVSLQGLPPGFYFYRFHGHSGGKHWSYGGKVLKQ